MRITFACPSASQPIGGVTALYDFGNGLARRGHHVQMIHLAMWGRQLETLADLERYKFEPGIEHFVQGDDPTTVPDSDLIFGTGAPERLGLPVLLVQGIDMLHPHLERQALRTPCLKICVASWLVGVGRRYGVPPEQMYVVPMGIDHEHYRVVTPLDQRRPVIAMLHSSHSAKGWDVGLAAIRLVHDRRPDVRCVVFGTVPPPGQLPDWIEFFLNPPPNVLAGEVYNRSRVFVQSSDYEGFGFTAVEAMACGSALVTTDNGGSDDYAIHGETALLAAPRDSEELARHAEWLLANDPERLRLAEAGQRYVQRFDWDAGSEQLEGHLVRYLADPDRFRQPPAPPEDPAVGQPLAGTER